MEKHNLWYRHIAIKMLACGLLYGVFTSCSGNGEVTSVVSANMLKSARYTVTANGKPVEVYKAALNIIFAKLLQKSEMRKDIVIELSYKGFG